MSDKLNAPTTLFLRNEKMVPFQIRLCIIQRISRDCGKEIHAHAEIRKKN